MSEYYGNIKSIVEDTIPINIEYINWIWDCIDSAIGRFYLSTELLNGKWLAEHLKCIVKREDRYSERNYESYELIHVDLKFKYKTWDVLLRGSNCSDNFGDSGKYGLFTPPDDLRKGRGTQYFIKDIVVKMLIYCSNEYIFRLISGFETYLHFDNNKFYQHNKMCDDDYYRLMPHIWTSILIKSYKKRIHIKRFCILLLAFVYELREWGLDIDVLGDRTSERKECQQRLDQIVEDTRELLISYFDVDNPDEYFPSFDEIKDKYHFDTDLPI